MSCSFSILRKIRLLSREKLSQVITRAKIHDNARPVRILGIETSCDDTGIAIVDGDGAVLGEALHSQQSVHLKYGGIIPTVARQLHQQHITEVCEKALKAANLRVRDLDAVAVTVKPGLSLSLMIGVKFGQYLSKVGGKPFIPVHHMEAHALMARMTENVDFPFLVLLISGGHCLLALVRGVDDFCLLGTTVDDAPGEALDKTARQLKMKNLPEYSNVSGGTAIELAARRATDPLKYEFPTIMAHSRDCNFSLAGLKNSFSRRICLMEQKHNVVGDAVIPDLENFCAAAQLAVTKHICHKTKRAMMFLDQENLLPKDRRTLVVSGGVACNDFIAKSLKILGDQMGWTVVRPPRKLCMDNGIMIAWNGVERWNADAGVIQDPAEIEKIDLQARASLGVDWTERVREANIQCSTVKARELYG